MHILPARNFLYKLPVHLRLSTGMIYSDFLNVFGHGYSTNVFMFIQFNSGVDKYTILLIYLSTIPLTNTLELSSFNFLNKQIVITILQLYIYMLEV